jgi:quercetin dioxygenase-like cupin family protein
MMGPVTGSEDARSETAGGETAPAIIDVETLLARHSGDATGSDIRPSSEPGPPGPDASRGGGGDGGSDGVRWTLGAPSDLNANLVRLGAGGAIGEHTNREVDVLIVAIAGWGRLTIDGDQVGLRPHVIVHVPKGARRLLEAGPDGLGYLTVHRRRGGLEIGRTGGRAVAEPAAAPADDSGDPACWAHLLDDD